MDDIEAAPLEPLTPGPCEPQLQGGEIPAGNDRTTEALANAVDRGLLRPHTSAKTAPRAQTPCEQNWQIGPHYGESLWSIQVNYGAAPLKAALALRERIYHSSTPYLLAPRDKPREQHVHPAQDELDPHSYQFVCRKSSRVVAACRFTPMAMRRLDSAKFEDLPATLRSQAMQLLQISRVVVDPHERQHKLAELIIAHACRWLADNDIGRYYFALCLPPLVRFYRHFGAQPFPNWKHTDLSRNGNHYRLIHGDLRQTATATFVHVEQWRRTQTTAPTA